MSQIDDEGFSQIEDWIRNKNNKIVLSITQNLNLTSMIHSDGTSLLHISAKYDNEEITTHLISDNMDVNAVNSFGETPLMFAIQHDATFAIWETLLNAGADLWQIINNSGQSALSMLLQRRYRHRRRNVALIMDEIEKRNPNIGEVVNVLLSAGCELYHLEFFKKVEITMQLLERGCPVNLQDPEFPNNTPLHIAAYMNDIENVEVLLQFGANRNVENSHGSLSIITALSNSQYHSQLIILLLPESKEWLKKDSNMYNTFRNCNSEVLEYLLKSYYIDLNARDLCDRTALHHLTSNSDANVWELCKYLKLDVDVCDINGIYVVHEAVKNNNPEALKYLLDAGAEVNILDENGRSILFYLPFAYGKWGWNQYEECIELLMQNIADGQAIISDEETIHSLLQNPLSPDVFIPIIVHLVIREARGATLSQMILDDIDKVNAWKNSFALSKKKLEVMKVKKLFCRTTYFDFLCDEEKKVWKYVQNEDILLELLQVEGEDCLNRIFMKRIERAVEIGRLYLVAGEFIVECIPLFKGNQNVLDGILDYLNVREWYLLAKYYE